VLLGVPGFRTGQRFRSVAVEPRYMAMYEDGSVIEGLYAAGAATGGLEGGPQIGYVGELAKSGITGLAAAEHVAQLLGKS
jgi:fumarate reductase flavoprotein subunit